MILPYRASPNTTAYDLAECVGQFCTTGITAVEDKNGVKCLLCITPSLSKTSGYNRYLIPLWPPCVKLSYPLLLSIHSFFGWIFHLGDVRDKNLWSSISTN